MVLHGDQWVRKTNTNFFRVSSAELLLASWPLTVAIQVCAVAIDVSVTDMVYLVRINILSLFIFGVDELSLFADGKENSVLVADT